VNIFAGKPERDLSVFKDDQDRGSIASYFAATIKQADSRHFTGILYLDDFASQSWQDPCARGLACWWQRTVGYSSGTCFTGKGASVPDGLVAAANGVTD